MLWPMMARPPPGRQEFTALFNRSRITRPRNPGQHRRRGSQNDARRTHSLTCINAGRGHADTDGEKAALAANAKEMHMKPSLMIAAAGLVAGLTGLVPAASAASCWDLWYERNAIYDQNGYCFSSSLGKRTFNNADCWTPEASTALRLSGSSPG